MPPSSPPSATQQTVQSQHAAAQPYGPRLHGEPVRTSLTTEASTPHRVQATSHDAYTTLAFWPLPFRNTALRRLGSDDFPPAAKHRAARDLGRWLQSGGPPITIRQRFPLHEIADAHHAAAQPGARGRTLITLT